MIYLIIAIYILTVFLSRWIFKKAFEMNRDESIKEDLYSCFIPIVNIIIPLMRLEFEQDIKRIRNGGKYKSWWRGKNW